VGFVGFVVNRLAKRPAMAGTARPINLFSWRPLRLCEKPAFNSFVPFVGFVVTALPSVPGWRARPAL